MGILSALNFFNLIDKMDGLLFLSKNVAKKKEGTFRFCLPFSKEWTGRKVELLLRQYSIPMGGRGYNDNGIYFSVRKQQAGWAEYIMLRAGI